MPKFLANHLLLAALLSWRISLFVISFYATSLIPVFGSRFPYWNEELVSTTLPNWVWGFGNFDGVHYLRIAKEGYLAEYSQAFFPLYPVLIKIINLDFFGFGKDFDYFYGALLISTIAFFSAIYFLYKLFRLDYDHRTTTKALILFITFPTAVYFGAVYTESLFLLLSVLTIYFTRKQNFLFAGIFAALASATKLLGVILVLLILIELIQKFKNIKIKFSSKLVTEIAGLLIAPFGLIAYMVYLQNQFGNSLYFLTAQPAFGAGRSDQPFILLPQVIYRYIKILLTVDLRSLAFFNASLELICTIIPLGLLVFFWKKIRLSYLVFMTGCLIIPTLTGTLSSMPRYSLVIFLILPLLVENFWKYFYLILGFFLILQIILVSFFTRGYWVS